jgi:hypothetical protein
VSDSVLTTVALGLVAQLVEQRTLNPRVVGSIPTQPMHEGRLEGVQDLAYLRSKEEPLQARRTSSQ